MIRKIRIGELGVIITGNTPPRKKPEYYGTSIPFIKATDIDEASKYTHTPEEFYSEIGYQKYRKSLIPKGSTCVVTIGSVGKKMTMACRECFINQAMNAIVPSESYDPEYVYYVVKYNLHKLKSLDSGTASGRENISKSAFSNLEIDVIDNLETQRKIGLALSAYDLLIENNQKQIKLLEEAAQRLYKEWFVDLRFPGHENTKITDGVPKGWGKYKFSDITSIMSGGTPKTDVKEFYNGNIPFYTPKDSDDSFFAFDTITHISQSGLDNCNSQLYPVNTVIITARGTVGKTTILAVPMAMNQSCYALKCDELNSPYYLFFSLKNEVAALKKMANGGVFNTIIVKTFDSIYLIAPTQDVLNMFEASVSPIMEQIKTKARQNIILTEARDRLLPKLMSGEIEL